jgi:hypothetical protein
VSSQDILSRAAADWFSRGLGVLYLLWLRRVLNNYSFVFLELRTCIILSDSLAVVAFLIRTVRNHLRWQVVQVQVRGLLEVRCPAIARRPICQHLLSLRLDVRVHHCRGTCAVFIYRCLVLSLRTGSVSPPRDPGFGSQCPRRWVPGASTQSYRMARYFD